MMLNHLISQLAEMKNYVLMHPGIKLEYYGLDVMSTGFSIYQYHLQLQENFDVFIADNIQTAETPRICVQLRSRMIVQEGISKAINDSYNAVVRILEDFSLNVNIVLENRIDYAFHTNLIQSSDTYFSDKYMKNHLRSQLRTYAKYGKIRDMSVDTLQLGQRKSNNVFFRAYNKIREVIEKNYKAFFFDIWLEERMISQFDHYVLREAYERKSYRMGLLVGRIKWYLEYGKNELLKVELRELLQSCYVKSDNADHIEKKLKGLIPEVTIILNIEFQTKRHYYMQLNSWLKDHEFKFQGIRELQRLYKLIYVRRGILDHLMSEIVSFVDHKGTKEEEYTFWWKRIRSCKIEYCTPPLEEFYRERERHTDLKRAGHNVLGSIASFNILLKNNVDERDFKEDVSDVLAFFNDNDLVSPDSDLSQINNYYYRAIQTRKARQYKGIIHNNEDKKK